MVELSDRFVNLQHVQHNNNAFTPQPYILRNEKKSPT